MWQWPAKDCFVQSMPKTNTRCQRPSRLCCSLNLLQPSCDGYFPSVKVLAYEKHRKANFGFGGDCDGDGLYNTCTSNIIICILCLFRCEADLKLTQKKIFWWLLKFWIIRVEKMDFMRSTLNRTNRFVLIWTRRSAVQIDLKDEALYDDVWIWSMAKRLSVTLKFEVD